MDNLLIELHHRYRPGLKRYDKEDLFSEYLAWLLTASANFRVDFIDEILDDSEADVSPDVFRDSVVDTQKFLEESNRFDIVLRVEGEEESSDPGLRHIVVVECKVGSQLYEEQLVAYHRELKDQVAPGLESAHLAALTPERPQNEVEFAVDEYPYWRGRMNWGTVQRMLESEVDEARIALKGSDSRITADEFEEQCGFIAIGGQFSDLLVEEGLVPPTAIRPRQDHLEFEDGGLPEERRKELCKLIRRATTHAKLESILEQHGFEARAFRTGSKRWAYNNIQHHKHHLRQAFNLEGYMQSFLFFGILLDWPVTGGLRRPEGESADNGFHVELVASVEIPDHANSRPAARWLTAKRNGTDALTMIVERLNDPSEIGEMDLDFFVPDETEWTKIVSRISTEGWNDLTAEEQVRRMSRFYRSFVERLATTEVPALSSDGEGILDLFRQIHEEGAGD